MPEAVIVSTARSPIGRAGKGSLKDMRADELTVQMARAALAKVPGLDPREITDLYEIDEAFAQFGVEFMCVGGGMGMAMVIERLS